MKDEPKPGSEGAIAQGCLCPVLSNNHGEGFPHWKGRGPFFWVSAGCPVHGINSKQKRVE